MSIVNELWGLIKPLMGMEEGQTIPKFLVKAGMKQATKLTPNLSKTILYGKNSRPELMNAFIKLLTSKDELGQKFRASFSEALRMVNLKTNLLLDDKTKIAAELNRQEEHKEDVISKINNVEANVQVDNMIDNMVDNITNKEEIDNNGI